MILTKLVYSIIIGENDIVFKKNIDYPILFTAMPCEVAESHMITVF